jgi:hypothetical protein
LLLNLKRHIFVMSILQNHIKYYVISSKMGKPALI